MKQWSQWRAVYQSGLHKNTDMETQSQLKAQKFFRDEKKSKLRKYSELVIGNSSILQLIKYELIITLISGLPGALGLFLRSKLYPLLIGKVGKDVVFGRNITLRHPKKIKIGNGVIIDDNCMIDAKGVDNEGITIEDGVFIGRNCIIYCKNGDIHLEENVNVSHNCEIFSSNKLRLCKNTLISAYCYLMSGGYYDYENTQVKMIDQDGLDSKGELVIGSNCWIGAGVVILDNASVGDNSVIGAGAVVTKQVPENSLAVGIPAKVVKVLQRKEIS